MAHVGVELHGVTPTAGSSSSIFLRPGHGCDGDATNSISVTLPEGVTTVKPQAKAGWKVSNANGVITWSGGELADDQFDEFGLRVTWPSLPCGVASQKYYFRTVQVCDAELTVNRSGGQATVSGRLPAHAGETVDLFVDETRLTIHPVAVGVDGTFRVVTSAGKVPAGALITARQEGRTLGTSTSGTEAWVDIPQAGSTAALAMPAPSVTVQAASGTAAR